MKLLKVKLNCSFSKGRKGKICGICQKNSCLILGISCWPDKVEAIWGRDLIFTQVLYMKQEISRYFAKKFRKLQLNIFHFFMHY